MTQTIKKKVQIEIDDWNPNLGSKNVLEFWFTVPGLEDTQEMAVPIWEIIESEIKRGTVEDYFGDGEGLVIVDSGISETYCQVRDYLIVSHGKKLKYTYEEWVREHLNDTVLINFIVESLKPVQ